MREIKFDMGFYYLDIKNTDYESLALCEFADEMGEIIGNIYENPELLKKGK